MKVLWEIFRDFWTACWEVIKLPFILITRRGDRELVVVAAKAGVNDYLIKPFTEAVLRQKVEEVIGKLS